MDQSKTVEQNLIDVFKVLENDLEELPKVMSTVLSTPSSNRFIETVFSLMEKVRTDERNKTSVELVKAELCVFINYGINCLEFAHYLDGAI